MDRRISTTDTCMVYQLGRAEMIRCLRDFLNKDRPEYHNTDCRMEKRSGELKRASEVGNGLVFKHTCIGSVLRAT